MTENLRINEQQDHFESRASSVSHFRARTGAPGRAGGGPVHIGQNNHDPAMSRFFEYVPSIGEVSPLTRSRLCRTH